MTDCKKLIMGFGYRNGKAFSWNGKLEYEAGLRSLPGQPVTTGQMKYLSATVLFQMRTTRLS